MASIIFIGVSLNLSSCSDQNSDIKTTENKSQAVPKNQPDKPLVANPVQPQAENQPPKPLTRSELKLITEEAKADEAQIKDVIKDFDANLNNKQARQEAQANLKAILPDYKEKMLQIGKAKLKEVH